MLAAAKGLVPTVEKMLARQGPLAVNVEAKDETGMV